MNLIELTHAFDSSIPVYPGDPKSTLVQTAFINEDTYNDHRLVTQMHVGTHMDAPLHMIKNGKRIDQLNLESFIGNGVIIDAVGIKEIGVNVLNIVEIKSNDIVLIYTGFDKKYGTKEYFSDSPFLKEDIVNALVNKRVKLIGLDFSGPDIDNSWQAHKKLLSNEIPIIENLTNLDKLAGVKNFDVIALPLHLRSDAAPVRVIARIK